MIIAFSLLNLHFALRVRLGQCFLESFRPQLSILVELVFRTIVHLECKVSIFRPGREQNGGIVGLSFVWGSEVTAKGLLAPLAFRRIAAHGASVSVTAEIALLRWTYAIGAKPEADL